MSKSILFFMPAILAVATLSTSYMIVDTGQELCYDQQGQVVSCSATGQDASYDDHLPGYRDNGDGTVTDTVTGLMWQQGVVAKMTFDEAVAGAESVRLGGFSDWRLPTIKELYSIMLFSGTDASGWNSDDTSTLKPFIDTDYFDFEYGDPSVGERIIDAQYASCTRYVSTTMNGDETIFGVNFADGRIKGYGLSLHGLDKTFFVRYVRGNIEYGINQLMDNGDGTISDSSSGLMWMQNDSGSFGVGDDHDGALTWQQALTWCEDLSYADYNDWRLPDAKQLQSIVDYLRSPATTGSAAIDPLFTVTPIIDEGGGTNYPFYWTGTTLVNRIFGGVTGVYVAFGEALGWMSSQGGEYVLMDVHGAGAQRSDPKMGDPSDYPYGRGPQGDVVRIYNYGRCVR